MINMQDLCNSPEMRNSEPTKPDIDVSWLSSVNSSLRVPITIKKTVYKEFNDSSTTILNDSCLPAMTADISYDISASHTWFSPK